MRSRPGRGKRRLRKDTKPFRINGSRAYTDISPGTPAMRKREPRPGRGKRRLRKDTKPFRINGSRAYTDISPGTPAMRKREPRPGRGRHCPPKQRASRGMLTSCRVCYTLCGRGRNLSPGNSRTPSSRNRPSSARTPTGNSMRRHPSFPPLPRRGRPSPPPRWRSSSRAW